MINTKIYVIIKYRTIPIMTSNYIKPFFLYMSVHMCYFEYLVSAFAFHRICYLLHLGKNMLTQADFKNTFTAENLFIILFSASNLSRIQIQNDKTRTVSFCRRTEVGTRKIFVGVRPCYRMGRSRRRDLCDWFERSGVTVQGSALSPGVSAPPGIHLPPKRRCPKDLYKFACRILADILTNDRCGG